MIRRTARPECWRAHRPSLRRSSSGSPRWRPTTQFYRLATVGLMLASTVVPGHTQEPDRRHLVLDSIVLERSACLGTCPAYRLSIASNGLVRFRSRPTPQLRTPTSRRKTETDSIPSTAFSYLAGEAARIGFTTFPGFIQADSILCASLATDFPSAEVSVFAADRAVTVSDYLGCSASRRWGYARLRLRQLRAFESIIDSVAGSRRWIRSSGVI